MVTLSEFAIIVITISLSGVMSPGPLFAANVAYGLKDGIKTGLKMAYGHTVVELPLVVLLGIGAISLTTIPQFREITSILGALSLFVFAGIQIKSVIRKPSTIFEGKHGPFLAGIILSGLNPFFLIWWFTIGFKLITDAIILYSFIGIGIMFAFHIWMDYAWICSVAFLSSKGKRIISNKKYSIFMIAISGVLVYFGIVFLLQLIH
ncbi:MAG TPA: LysE family transporter [Nitrosopumilaceae archaeon]|nr:LysE family transporter [Nitrosopumilaceae archaeon]